MQEQKNAISINGHYFMDKIICSLDQIVMNMFKYKVLFIFKIN